MGIKADLPSTTFKANNSLENSNKLSANISLFSNDYIKSGAGFTLIEMLVTVAVIALLCAGVVFYGNSSRSSIALFQAQYKIVGELNQAKFLTLQFFKRDVFADAADCGYGVHFDVAHNSMFIYKNKKGNSGEVCADPNRGNFEYESGDYIQPSSQITIDPSVKISSIDFIDAVFIAPYAQVFTDKGTTASEYHIVLTASGVSKSATITINSYGQVSPSL